MTKITKSMSLPHQRKSVDVGACEYCGELLYGYTTIEAGRAFCKLPSTCSEEWRWNYHFPSMDLRKEKVG